MPTSVDSQPCPHRADEPCSVCVELASVRSRLAAVIDELRALTEHHIECERLGTALADAAKALLGLTQLRAEGDPIVDGEPGKQAFVLVINALRDTTKAFLDHQWPDLDRPSTDPAIQPE